MDTTHIKPVAYTFLAAIMAYAAIRLFEHWEMKRNAKRIATAIAENTAVDANADDAATATRED